MPLTVGGGVRSTDDMRTLLRAGADKISLNSAALTRPRDHHRGRRRFRQPVHGRLHRREEKPRPVNGPFFSRGGRDRTKWEARAWGREGPSRSARAKSSSTASTPTACRPAYDLEITRADQRSSFPSPSSPAAARGELAPLHRRARPGPGRRRAGRQRLPLRQVHHRRGEGVPGRARNTRAEVARPQERGKALGGYGPCAIPKTRHNFPPWSGYFQLTGARAFGMLRIGGQIVLLLQDIVRCLFRYPIRFNLLIKQIDFIGAKSVPVVIITGWLHRRRVRGAMRVPVPRARDEQRRRPRRRHRHVPRARPRSLRAHDRGPRRQRDGRGNWPPCAYTEQIDALRSLAVYPTEYLIVPRFLAMLLSLPILVGLAITCGIGAGYFVAVDILHVPGVSTTGTTRSSSPTTRTSGSVW